MFWQRKTRPGTVYLGESTRRDCSKQIYTGMTRRPVWVRWREHMRGYGGKYTSRGTWFRPLGAVWSTNPRKAEQTIKHMTPFHKRLFARYAARQYRQKNNWW